MNRKQHEQYLKREDRREVPDPTPVEMPLRFRNMGPSQMRDEIRMMVREAMSDFAHDQGFETFEEADDFDIDDEPDLVSPYEIVEMVPEYPEVVDEDVSNRERSGGPRSRSEGGGKPPAVASSDGAGDDGEDGLE